MLSVVPPILAVDNVTDNWASAFSEICIARFTNICERNVSEGQACFRTGRIRHYRSRHSPSQIAARFRPFWYSPRLVFIISFWSNPIGLCSLAYICASIGILWRSTRIGFGSDSFRSIHYPSLCCHRTSFDPPSFIRR